MCAPEWQQSAQSGPPRRLFLTSPDLTRANYSTRRAGRTRGPASLPDRTTGVMPSDGEPSPKKARTERDAVDGFSDVFTEDRLGRKIANCARATGKSVPQWDEASIEFNPDSPHAVVARGKHGSIVLPMGEMIMFFDTEGDHKRAKLTVNLGVAPDDAEGTEALQRLSTELGHGKDSMLFRKFHTLTKVPAGHKFGKKLNDGAVKKFGDARDPKAIDWKLGKCYEDNQLAANGGKASFTKYNPKLTEDGKLQFSASVSLFDASGRGGVTLTDAQLDTLPVVLADYIKASPFPLARSKFYSVRGPVIPIYDVLAQVTTSRGGAHFAVGGGRMQLTGINAAWTTGEGSANFNRILTTPWVRKFDVIGFRQNQRDEEEEVPDEALLDAFDMD